ncbi:CBS domain-containing protein [Streptomyces sp. NPDC046862]|uniref:CBS domain-containing protein n=1 Tax=Streptomyces sp. NPDC046862 TaxID=3154603 RepID=UPI0034571AE9
MRHNKVGTVMTTEVVRAEHGTPFKEVARLLADHRISGLPVVDEDEKVIGVISETDLMVRQAQTRAVKARARTAGQLMSEPPVTVRADATIVEAARTMAQARVERLPVLDEEGRLVGIVTRRDLLQVFLRPDKDIREEVIQEVLVRALWPAPRTVDVSVAQGVVTLEGHMERRSETDIAVSMTRQIDGVVAVVDRLTHRSDDARRRPGEPALRGGAAGGGRLPGI